jgi:outer membrane receptor protein involved in Fe transport
MSRFRFTAVLTVLVLVAVAAFAQGTTSSIVGTVTHEGAPLPGVTVTISSPSLQGTRTTVTNDSGLYNFGALPPGEYTVSFVMDGMQTVTRRVVASLAQTARADANMRLSGLAEAITVTAAAPSVLETNQVSFNITKQEVEDLPVGRTIVAQALMAPGVSAGLNANQLVISGAPGYDNLLLVNGVVVNENLRSQMHNLFIEDAVQETTVLTGGISAEYGRFTGGVVSSITKSGGNEFSGSVRDSMTNQAWTRMTPFAGQAARADEIRHVYEGTLGGFILRDRLWFFGAGRVLPATTSSRETSLTSIPYTFSDEEQRLEGKLTGTLLQRHTLSASYIDVARDIQNTHFGTIYDERSLYNTSQPNTLAALNYSGILTSNFLVEAQAARKEFTFVGSGSQFTDLIFGTLMVDRSGGRRWWSPTFCGVCSDEERNNDSYLLKGTYYLNTANLGTHNLTLGVENFAETRLANNHQSGSDWRVHANTVRDSAGNPILIDGSPVPIFQSNTLLQWTPIFQVSPGSDLQTNSIFLNDRWDLNNRLSFNLGVRYDQNDAVDSAGNVVSDDSAFSPRLGATFDVFGDGRHRVNASYGQYVSKIMDGNVGGAGSAAGNPASIIFEYQGPNVNTGSGPYIGTEQALRNLWAWFETTGGITNWQNNPTLSSASIPGVSTQFPQSLVSPAMDEITLGYGVRIGRNSFLRADLINREWKNFYASLLTTETPRIGNTDVRFIVNTNEIERKYEAVVLQGGTRFGRLSVGGNYTWSELRGNDEGEGAATATSPNTPLGMYYPEYLGYRQRLPVGIMEDDQTHRGRIWAGYDFMLGRVGRFNVSAVHQQETGAAYSAVGTINARAVNPVANPGYGLSALGTSHTYYFSERGAFRSDDFVRTDLALNYYLPIWRSEFFVQGEVLNIFDNSAVTTHNRTVRTLASAGAASGLSAFNPFTTTPIECPQGAAASVCSGMGAHWQKATTFGGATGTGSYQLPLTYRVSLGLRF